jgi:hypothetical protein
VGPDFALRRFRARLESAVYDVTMIGRPEGSEMVLTIAFRGRAVEERIPFDPRIITADAFTPFSTLPALRPGLRWPMQVLNPLTQNFEVGWAEVGPKEPFTLHGKPVLAYKIALEVPRLGVLYAWVTEQGLLLKESGPLGLVLVREGVDT